MAPGPESLARNVRLTFLAGAIVTMAAMASFLPSWVIAFNDDFAYLRSVVATLQHGRPWTDDFLEPWAMSLTSASATLYRLTGSFTVATLGLQIVLPAVSFYFAARFVYAARQSRGVAILVSLLIFTAPTVLWKEAEYTAIVVYLPALVVALWAAARSRWGVFLGAYAVGVASRQSAVTWLVIPAVAVIEDILRERRWRTVWRPAAACLIGIGWWGLLSRYANLTHAQQYVTARAFHDLNWQGVFTAGAIAIWITVTALGVVAIAMALGGRAAPAPALARRIAGTVVAFALLGSMALVGRPGVLSCEHPLFDFPYATTYLRALVLVGAAGWALRPPSLGRPNTAATVAAIGLVALRGQLWDYYLLDPVLIAGFGAMTASPAIRSESAVDTMVMRHPLGLRVAAGLLLVSILGAQIAASAVLKRSLDERAAFCAVLERALRAGWMKPTELSHAPFGFVAWHLAPYYFTHDGAASGDLGGFGGYVARNSVDVRVDDVAKPVAIGGDQAHPFAEIRPRGWGRLACYWLDRRKDQQTPELRVSGNEYRIQQFPLNDAEWRRLIRAGKR